MAKRAAPMRESPEAPDGAAQTSPRQPKLPLWLVSTDENLWSQVNAGLGADMTARQFDAIDELIAATPAGQNAVVFWDARGEPDVAGVLTRLQVHSSRLAVVAVDEAAAASAPAWVSRQQQQQVVAVLALPAAADRLAAVVAAAREEAGVRVALLGESAVASATGGGVGERRAPARRAAPRPGLPSWLPFAAGGVAFAALASAVAFWLMRSAADAPQARPPPVRRSASGPVAPGGAPSSSVPGTDDQVFALIDKARQAMTARHFIDPVDGSALALYRQALVLDPGNGEAQQGAQRIEEILVARTQSALDERRFDVALQSLETARSINPDDVRLQALDAHLAGLRAEIGPAQIQAAITAQNFDRAAQLIDDAARAKVLPAAKLAQLREDLRRHQAEQEASRLSTLIAARLQQDHLIDPLRDSALFYLNQARTAGGPALTEQWQDFYRRGTLAAHAAIEQHRFSDADRWVGELRTSGLGAAPLAALQQALAEARAALPSVQNKPVASPFVDLVRARLASGNLVEPEGDSALAYLNQLRATDPQNAALAQLTGQLQSLFLERARAALDAGQVSRAEGVLQQAAALGPSADTASLDARLQAAKSAAAAPRGPVTVGESALKRTVELRFDYPEDAQNRRLEGWVEVSFAVSADGKVSQAHVLKSVPAGVFDAAALRAVSRLRYQPPMVDGKPGAVLTALRLVFRIER